MSDPDIVMTGWRVGEPRANVYQRQPQAPNSQAPPVQSSSSLGVGHATPIEILSDDDDDDEIIFIGRAPKRRISQVIDLTLDHETDREDPRQPMQKRKRSVISVSIISDDDEGPLPSHNRTADHLELGLGVGGLDIGSYDDENYDTLHAGYEIPWSTDHDVETDQTTQDNVDCLVRAVESLDLGKTSFNMGSNLSKWSDLRRINFSRPRKFQYKGIPSLQGSLLKERTSPIYNPYWGGRSRIGLLKHSEQEVFAPLKRLAQSVFFQMAERCLSISQSFGQILIASGTPGGDGQSSVIDPYNSGKTLALFSKAQTEPQWLDAHFLPFGGSSRVGTHSRHRFFNVNCARFDPNNSNVFASAGGDGVITIWESIGDLDVSSFNPAKQWGNETYKGQSCHDIVYRPPTQGDKRSIFASPSSSGRLFIQSYNTIDNSANDFAVNTLQNRKPGNNKYFADKQNIGATVWGRGPTSDMIFFCSEISEGRHADTLFHGAFNFNSGKHIYYLDDHRNGEELALDHEGRKLALFTNDDGKLFFRLYDVNRTHPISYAKSVLPHERCSVNSEVRTASWSPDGILLAVGTSDDSVYVYDARQLHQVPRPLLSFSHQTRSPSQLGITILEWTTDTSFRNSRLGLLTGGGDQCVMLRDVKTAWKKPFLIAEIQGEIGGGNFGDITRGEKPLVVGDTDGRMHVFDLKTSGT